MFSYEAVLSHYRTPFQLTRFFKFFLLSFSYLYVFDAVKSAKREIYVSLPYLWMSQNHPFYLTPRDAGQAYERKLFVFIRQGAPFDLPVQLAAGQPLRKMTPIVFGNGAGIIMGTGCYNVNASKQQLFSHAPYRRKTRWRARLNKDQ